MENQHYRHTVIQVNQVKENILSLIKKRYVGKTYKFRANSWAVYHPQQTHRTGQNMPTKKEKS
jgi:hypothetical protein